jgi:2-haloalkanoic acid dehalogenase type II
LIDWRAGIEATLGRLLREQGYTGRRPLFPVYLQAERVEEEGYARYRDVLASTAIRVAETAGVPLSASRAREFADSLPSWPAFADTAPVLRELGRRGIGRFILSNVDRDLLRETIRRNALEVDGFVTAEDVRSYKPAPAHWVRFFRDHVVDRTCHLHVAQSVSADIVPATELGLRTAWINRYDEVPRSSDRPTYTFSDLRGLLSIARA